ncbi:SRPBCC family protein [Pedobacter sp. SYP-B3415]|uniref:SRPBCC family protein n=1 Tax=Pedobacter sp. SYP-B3415 TaxID=2496641 RepID=UPI0013EDD8A6|nr:SRPBCC family protein [Pedobacter sp. SYP-B3415]
MKNQALVFERTYEAPIEKVWTALTDAKQLRQWYFEIEDFRPEVGFEFEFTAGPEGGTKYKHICRITACVPPEKLSYSWRYEGFPGDSEVTFELFAESERETRLKLTHSGLDSFPQDDGALSTESFSEDWNHITGIALRNFVETGLISKSIEINVSAEKIWEVLINPNNTWGLAFGGGAKAESDWRQGSNIVWTDLEGNVGTSGIINKFDPGASLELRYYDQINPKPGDSLGAYTELFTLEKTAKGSTILTITAGPIEKMYLEDHREMWEKALAEIKNSA